MTLDSRDNFSIFKPDNLLIFPQITHIRFYLRPFNKPILEDLLKSLPSIKRFSIDTLTNKSDYIRAPFWTSLFQKYLPYLERIRLVVRGFYTVKPNDLIDGNQYNILNGYRYDRYWIDKAYKKVFTLYVTDTSTVLQIR